MSYNERYLWTDPVPERMRIGVLLSDQIRFFVEAVHLIDPRTFTEDDLRPASYDLHIGDECYVDDDPKPFGPTKCLRIPANGLVYIKTKEIFNLPYYMVARYSLQVTQVYRGLLIDDGLHIDPGYHGPIYVPIHNFTDQERTLLQGQPFLSVEFSRTTPLPAAPLERIRVEAELVGAYGKKGLDGYEGHGVILFNKDLEGLRRPPRTPRHFWNKFPAEQHKSAMIGTEDRLKALGDDVTERLRKSERNVSDQLRRSERIGYVGLLGLLVALLAIMLPLISARYFAAESAYEDSTRRVQALSDELAAVKKQIAAAPTARTSSASSDKGK